MYKVTKAWTAINRTVCSDCYNTSPHSVIASQLLYVYTKSISASWNYKYRATYITIISVMLSVVNLLSRFGLIIGSLGKLLHVKQPNFKYVYQLVIAFDLANKLLSPVALGYISSCSYTQSIVQLINYIAIYNYIVR